MLGDGPVVGWSTRRSVVSCGQHLVICEKGKAVHAPGRDVTERYEWTTERLILGVLLTLLACEISSLEPAIGHRPSTLRIRIGQAESGDAERCLSPPRHRVPNEMCQLEKDQLPSWTRCQLVLVVWISDPLIECNLGGQHTPKRVRRASAHPKR